MKALIILPYLAEKIKSLCNIDDYQYVICADNSFELAKSENIVPNIIIGDFDHNKSTYIPKDIKVIQVPSMKDDTDEMLCIKHAIEMKYDEIDIVGGIGGRLDHTFANIQSLMYALGKNVSCTLISKNNTARLYKNGKYDIKCDKQYISIFSYSEESNISISGAKYSIDNITIKNDFPIGVSNESLDGKIILTINEGIVLVICSND